MSKDLTLHELTPSPNNVKVRIGLGYKGLSYSRQPLTLDGFPGDRSSVVALSRQPRLPVLQHGETKIFDSGAILRYLEANFPDTPPLFVEDHAQFAEIEKWELFARTQLGEVLGMFFGQIFAPDTDPAVIEKANALLHERTAELETLLATQPWLVGDHLTAADIAVAAPLYLADLSDAHVAISPLVGFFKAHVKFADRPHTLAWVRKVLAFDPVVSKPETAAV